MKKGLISLAIATRNRAAVLEDVLRALIPQAEGGAFFLIVVDNGSTDNTPEMLRELLPLFPEARYIREERVGLSHARNAALEACATPWLCYLDDDAMPAPDYIEQLSVFIEQNSFSCVGGALRPWLREPLPAWFVDEYESDEFARPSHPGLLPEKLYVSGGNMGFKASVLRELGGFDPDFGVVGERVAFGEETELQLRLRERGHTIGYTPAAVVYHFARPGKYTIRRMLLIRFRAGESDQLMSRQVGGWGLISLFPRIFLSPVKALFRSVPKMVSGEYRWENVLIETVGAFLYVLGRICFWERSRKKSGECR